MTLLAKLDTNDPDYIDLSYGEPFVVSESLKEVLPDFLFRFDAQNHEYQPPNGNKDLVKFLEDKYNCNVIVTSGAKHGILAVFYALKQLNKNKIYVKSPYWASIPWLAKYSDLEINCNSSKDCDSIFLISPNNPDGEEIPYNFLKSISTIGKTLIHDGVYYNPIYSNADIKFDVGDVQIISCAKLYGLSGLRVGYLLCHNKEIYKHAFDYIEDSIAGVSTASQCIILEIEKFFKQNPDKLKEFQSKSRNKIEEARLEFNRLEQKFKVIKPNSNSMFGWFKNDNNIDFKILKVGVVNGELFGKKGFVRINLAVGKQEIKRFVDRILDI